MIIFNSYPLIQKYVIDPYYAEQGKDNPEYDYLKPLDEDESVFTDKGGEEAPIEGKSAKKKKKGKTISWLFEKKSDLNKKIQKNPLQKEKYVI